MAKIKVTMEAGDYGEQDTVWNVPEDLVRPYAIALQAWIAKGYVVISKKIYDELIDGSDGSEFKLGKAMIEAVDE